MAIGEMSGKLTGKKLCRGKLFIGTLHLGLCRCLVVLYMCAYYTVKYDVGNCCLGRSDAKSLENVVNLDSLWRVVTVIMLSFCSACL